MSEKHVDRAIRQVLKRGRADLSGSCPDFNLLAAYLEHRLEGAEKDAFEAHAGECQSCRQLIAMAMTIGEEPAVAEALPSPEHKRLLFHIAIPVSSLVLIIFAVAAGILYMRYLHQPAGAPFPTQTAELRIAAQKPASGPAAPLQEKLSAVRTEPRPAPAAKKEPVRAAAETKKTVPEAETPAIHRTQAAERAAEDEVADLRAKSEARQMAAAVEYSPVRIDSTGRDQAVRAKDVSGDVVGGATGGIVGGIVGPPPAAALQKTAAFNLASVEPSPRDAIRESGSRRGPAESSGWNRVGDRGFRFVSGYWIDEQCNKSPDKTIVEVREGSPDFEEIFRLYPDLRRLRPVIILWKDKILVLR